MDIQPYIEMLRRRFWIIILTFLATLAVVALGSMRMTPIYSAESLVRVAQPQADTVNWNDLNYTTRLIETNVQVLKSRPFLDEVIQRLRLPTDATSLGKAVNVEAVANTELIRITAESANPSQAAATANTLGTLLVEQGQQMYTGQGKSSRDILQEQVALLEQQLARDRIEYASVIGAKSEVTATADMAASAEPGAIGTSDGWKENLAAKIRAEEQSYVLLLGEYDKARVSEALRINSVSMVEPAMVPLRPSKPNLKLNLALGALVGILGGVGLAFLLDTLDPTIRSVDDLAKRLGVCFLARIPQLPRDKGKRPEDLLLATNSPSSGSEAFMTLTASISSLGSGVSPRSFVITSAEPGAGKSTVTVNLAALLAQTGRDVIVVDGDMRNPSLHRALGLARAPGLSDVMMDRDCLTTALRQTRIPGLRVLAAGSPQVNPAGLWQTNTVSELAARLASEAEIVLWDTPPVLAAADALFLAPAADAVLFVVARDQSKLKQVELALAQLRHGGSESVAVVYNQARKEDWSYYDYYRRKSPPLIETWNPSKEDLSRDDARRRAASSDTRQRANV